MRGIQFSEIWSTLQRTNPALAFLPLVFIALAICLSSFRWSRIAGPTVRFKEAVPAMLIGMFINNVLPARLGEVARGYALAHKKNFSFTYSFSTVLLDRFFDLTGLLLITFIFFPSGHLPLRVSQGIYAIMAVLVLCVLMIILLSRKTFVDRLSKRFTNIEKSFLAKFAKRIVEIQENLARIRSPMTLIYFIVISFFTWLSMSAALYCVIKALGVSVPPLCIPFVCALLNIGITVPSSPGYVGVYQFLLVYLLSIFGVPNYEGFTISIIFHASWYIPYTVVGFILLLREHLHIRDIQKFEDQDDAA
jgi:uncharacterized protein (TIRG00374 family)